MSWCDAVFLLRVRIRNILRDMRDNLEFWIAWRHLRKRRGERFISLITWLSVAGVTLGVASLICVFSVLTGYKETLRDKIVGMNAHVTAYPDRRAAKLDETIRRVLEVPGVTEAAPFLMGQAMVASSASARGVAVRGVDPSDRAVFDNLGKTMQAGDIGALSGKRAAIALGRELAAELGVKVGDQVRVTVPGGGTPKLMNFRVAGIFSSGMFEFDSKISMVGIDDARTLFGVDDGVSGIEVRVDDLYRSEEYAVEINRALGPSWTVLDWKRLNRNMFYALELQRVVLSLIMGLVVLVAAFNVTATLIMVVLEKTREIGILKAMGASARTIGRIFAIEGLLVGVAGAAAGSALGLTLCFLQKRFGLISIPSDVYLFDKLPVSVDPLISALFALGAVLLCYAAAVYPSWRAGRLDPVEAIRME